MNPQGDDQLPATDLVHSRRSDIVSAWAVGAGAGLIVLMVTWLIGNRILSLALGSPRGPVAAILTAVAAGAGTWAWLGRRLSATVRAG